MNPEVLSAKRWYAWLWLSPLLTVPSLVFIVGNEPGYQLVCGGDWSNCNYRYASLVTGLIAVFGSALWHLLLLIPASNEKSQFVRWHGRQSLLLAGIRTAIPIIFLLLGFFLKSSAFGLLAIVPLIPVWFFSAFWGQGQASRGDCSLMRWTGHSSGLPLPTRMADLVDETSTVQKEVEEDKDVEADVLVAIFRFGRDPEQRRIALARLERLGMVEPM